MSMSYPAEGGEPARLTWHPGEDIVRGFTPRGEVIFSSQRSVFSRRHSQFFVIDTTGGVPKRLPVPTGDKAAISPDGKYLAYTPAGEVFRQWKNYRGGTASRIWVLKLDDLSHVEIPKPAGGCNDTEPMWVGETVYFLSDRDGEFNLYSYDRGAKAVARCTDHDAFPMASASSGAGRVIYEQAGWIHVLRPEREAVAPPQDRRGRRPRRDPSALRKRSQAHPEPSQSRRAASRAVLEYRGEIVTVPAKKGDPRQPQPDAGVHMSDSPAWAPDGKSIAYFSDASGEYQLVVRRQDGKGEGRSYPLQWIRLLPGAGVVAR